MMMTNTSSNSINGYGYANANANINGVLQPAPGNGSNHHHTTMAPQTSATSNFLQGESREQQAGEGVEWQFYFILTSPLLVFSIQY